MKKYFIVYISIVFIISSCDKRKDYFREFNEPPTLQINSKDNIGSNHIVYTNDVVDSFKISQSPYRLNVLSSDESEGNLIEAFVSPNDNIVFNKNAPIKKGSLEEISGVILFTPSSANTYIINLSAKDRFEEESFADARIVVFNNKPPVIPWLIITHDPNLNQYEYNMDASAAFDQDEKYGGEIVKYNWQVDGNYNVETEFNIIQYIFPAPGTYQVRVRCQDNDGDWSAFRTVSHVVM